MATATTSGPQQGVNMPAVDLRRLNGTSVLAEGIRTAADLQVAQRGAGANMSVDVSAGSCYVQDDHAGGGGFYHGVWAATENAVISAADPTNPRIDRIVAQVSDSFLGDASNSIAITVVKGTATAGATLANLNGAAAVPGSALLLANVLVPALAGSIVTANIANVASLLKLVGSGGALYRKTTSKAVNTTVAATDLLNGEITVAAGAMGTTGLIRLTALGDWLNTSGGAVAPPRLQLLLGGTTIFDTSTGGTATSDAIRRGWRLVVEILNAGSASAQISSIVFDAGMNTSTALNVALVTGEGSYKGPTTGTAFDQIRAQGVNPATAINTAVACALVLNVINGSASASYETKLLGATVEIL